MTSIEYRGMNLIIPENDKEFFGHFEAAKEERLVVKQCNECQRLRWPPGSGCPWCMSLDWSWQPVSGKGTIYSYEIIVHAIQPGFKDIAPYPVVIVELDEQSGEPTADEGIRMTGNLVTDDMKPEAEANVAIGKRVEVIFQELGNGDRLPQFKLSDEPPKGPIWQFPN